jgi:peptidoglycan/LPS O-acetylase OafA/YrhL
MKGGIVGACWSHLSFLGVVNYSFYLFHQPIIGLAGRALDKVFPETLVHPLILFAICIVSYPIILILSTIIYKWIEQPSIALGKATWQRIEGVSPD